VFLTLAISQIERSSFGLAWRERRSQNSQSRCFLLWPLSFQLDTVFPRTAGVAEPLTLFLDAGCLGVHYYRSRYPHKNQLLASMLM